jgi:hypothetical protein
MAELDVLAERLRQQQRDRRAAIADRLRRAQANDAARRGPHVAGDRVFDTVTGLEGEVIHVARENVVVPAPQQSAG